MAPQYQFARVFRGRVTMTLENSTDVAVTLSRMNISG